jgi:hypothetical protein
VGFVVDKVALGQVFSEYFGFPANLHSTKSSIIIIARGRYNRPFCGRRAKWTQLGLHLPHVNLKKTPKYSSLSRGFIEPTPNIYTFPVLFLLNTNAEYNNDTGFLLTF